MGRRKIPTGTPLPKALACAMLEDGGRMLFLVRKDANGIERIEMPSVLVPSGRSPFADIKEAFQRMTGIDGEFHEIVLEGRHNAGFRRRKNWVPVLVFKVTAKNRTAKPSAEFSGFRWLSLEDAKRQKLSRNAEWMRKLDLENKGSKEQR
ncbi:NUDIX hydrolase [Candidatus Micrarchaeota archaeon]|nr:NUDIX hydrolase [Candidatus Micrarchaeota archaeon]